MPKFAAKAEPLLRRQAICQRPEFNPHPADAARISLRQLVARRFIMLEYRRSDPQVRLVVFGPRIGLVERAVPTREPKGL